MTWRSRLPELEQRTRRANEQALIAAATVLQNAVRQKLRGGYTTGRFVTGTSAASVRYSPVEHRGMDASITVGTNVEYALAWELGHWNLFTRKYERVPYWEQAMTETRPAIGEAFRRVWLRSMA